MRFSNGTLPPEYALSPDGYYRKLVAIGDIVETIVRNSKGTLIRVEKPRVVKIPNVSFSKQ